MPSQPQLKLMTELLKIEGLKIVNYQSLREDGMVLYVEKIQQSASCIYCGAETRKLHKNNELTIRDLPWGETDIYLKINRRQMRCLKCGQKFTEELEYVQKKRRYTERFTRQIVEEVLNSDIKNVSKRNRISEQEIETMLKDIGAELREEKPRNLKQLGIDEIAVVKGQGNYYVVLVDLEKGKLIGLIEKRTEQEVTKYLEGWGEEVLSQIEEVSIDLWKPYKKSAEKLMPQAEIVADRFHLMKQVNDELDRERKKVKIEVNQREKSAEKTTIIEGLKKSKYVLLKNEKELKEREISKLEEVREVCPRLGIMHGLKEQFRKIFDTEQKSLEGLLEIADWLKEAYPYFPQSCGTIRRWIGQIIPYFDHRTTQGCVEGINNKLKLIKRRGYGFRNFDNFQLRSFLNWHFSS